MRDPKRITRIVWKLWRYWRTYPDLRLGQLIVNLTSVTERGFDPFFLEDDKLEAALDAMLPPTDRAETVFNALLQPLRALLRAKP